jgi:hypothetical protein
MIVREVNDNGDEVSIVIEQVVAWKCGPKRITVYAGSHTFAFFGDAAQRMESRLRAHLGDSPGAFGPPSPADAAA